MSVDTPEVSEQTYSCPRCGAEYSGGDACPSCGLLRAPVPCDDEPGRQARYRCVICGRTVCGNEPSGTHAAVCELHEGIPMREGWAQVYSTSDDIEAGLIVQNLEAEGIDAQRYSQKDDNFPVDLGELAIVRVLVPAWEFQQALEVIRAHMDDAGEVGFACWNCGEVYEQGQTVCASCGADLMDNDAK